jgi:molecular chaperone GrpE
VSDKKTSNNENLDEMENEQPEDAFDAVAKEKAAEVSEGGETDIERELEEARKEARENQDKMLRMAAECENLRKRMQREKETSLKYAEENIVKELLPSIDNFERAVEQGRNSNDTAVLLEGVEMTMKGLLAALEKFGLKPVVSLGEPFDPNYHEAMAMEASKDVPEQHVKQVYEKGYFFKERLIRAAKVVVSKGDVEE